VSPGRHQLVATGPGLVPDTRQVAVSQGERVRHVLAPLPIEESMIRTERRWAVWKPWAAVGASAVFFAGAAYFDHTSSQEFDRFDRAFSQRCGDGCGDAVVPAAWVEDLHRAETEQRIALTLYVTGGAVLATGAVLVFLNRERIIRVSADDAADVALLPVLSPRGAGLSAAFRF
jgi:hypothetical protein